MPSVNVDDYTANLWLPLPNPLNPANADCERIAQAFLLIDGWIAKGWVVREYSDLGQFPLVGEKNIIYFALDVDLFYRWDGEKYILVGAPRSSDEVPEGEINLYFTAARAKQIDDNLKTHENAPVAHTRAQVGLSQVDNTSDLNKPLSNATVDALALKQATLVSGANIKTVNGKPLLGAGDMDVSGEPSSVVLLRDAGGALTGLCAEMNEYEAVNIDPLFFNAAVWAGLGFCSVKQIADGVVGPNVLSSTSANNGVVAVGYQFPVDVNKTYLFEAWIRALAKTDGYAFAIVRCFDSSGQFITIAGTGWPSTNPASGNCYFPSISTVPQTTWTRHALTVGPNGAAKFPTGTVKCALGMYMNYKATTNVETQVNMFRVSEIDKIPSTLSTTITRTADSISKISSIRDGETSTVTLNRDGTGKLTGVTSVKGV